MTKVTQTKLARARGFDKTILGYLAPQKSELFTCKGCGRTKLLSVGQIWKCKHI